MQLKTLKSGTENYENYRKARKINLYGPEGEGPHTKYWNDLAQWWGTNVAHAQSFRCKSCSAFVKNHELTEEIKDNIKQDVYFKQLYFSKDVKDLGYCHYNKTVVDSHNTCLYYGKEHEIE